MLAYDSSSGMYSIQMCDDRTTHAVHRVIVRFQKEDVAHFCTRMIRAVKCREIAIDLWRLKQYYLHTSTPVHRRDVAHYTCVSLARIILLVSAHDPTRLRRSSTSTPDSLNLTKSENVSNQDRPNPNQSLNPGKV